MFRRSGAAALLALAVTAGSALSATAAAPILHCGDHVSTNLVLQQDLTCVGTALYLVIPETGALKVDLNGHRLKGNGTGTGLETATFHPVNETLSGSLTVSNGTITGFAAALVGPAQWSNPSLINLTVQQVKFTTNGSWLPGSVMTNVLIDRSSMLDSGLGGARGDSRKFIVQNSSLTRSFISSNGESNNYLYNNTFVGGSFSSGTSSNVTATGNTFRDCGDGIRVAMNDMYSTRVEGNLFRHCSIGVRFDGMVLGTVTVKNNVFLENTVSGMTYLNKYVQDLRITGNSFLYNTGDGLSGVDSLPTIPGPGAGAGPTLISGNIAIGNGGLGIKAVGVVRDGHDNIAHHNGDPAQCSGVVCL
jgi:hypothetical protein